MYELEPLQMTDHIKKALMTRTIKDIKAVLEEKKEEILGEVKDSIIDSCVNIKSHFDSASNITEVRVVLDISSAKKNHLTKE